MTDISPTSETIHSPRIGGNSSASSVKREVIQHQAPKDRVDLSKTAHGVSVAPQPSAGSLSAADRARYVDELRKLRDMRPEEMAVLDRDAISETSKGIAKDLGFSVDA